MKSPETPTPKVEIVDGFPRPIPPIGRAWLTTAEVAAALEVPVRTVRRWAEVGVTVGEIGLRHRVRLKRCLMGGVACRFYPDAVLTFIKQTSAPPCEASLPAPLEGDEQRAARLAAVDAELVRMGIG